MRSFVGGLVVALCPLGLLAQTGPESAGSEKCAKGSRHHLGRPLCELSRAGAKKGWARSEPAGDGIEGGKERGGDRAGITRREPAG